MQHLFSLFVIFGCIAASLCQNRRTQFSNDGSSTSPSLIHQAQSTSTSYTPDRSRTDQDPRYDPKASEFISQSVTRLAYNIGQQFDKNRLSGAQIFSPTSIASAMSLVLLGSNGRTYQEMMRLFGYDSDSYFTKYPFKIHEEFGFLIEDLVADSPNPIRDRNDVNWRLMDKRGNNEAQNAYLGPVSNFHQIHVANGVFVQNGYSLRPDYIDAVRDVYKSEITSLDFERNGRQAKDYINDWVNRNTRGKIPVIVSDEVQPDTKVILGSALYFKAFWDTKFLGTGTTISDFYPDGLRGPSIKVNMMANGGIFPFYEGKDCDCKIMGLPYQGNLSTMYIFQPHDSNRQKLRALQDYLTPEKTNELIDKMRLKTAILAFPKLHISNSFNLRKLFTNMGVSTLFSNRNSDLSLIAEGSGNSQQSRPARPASRPIFDRYNNNNRFTGDDLHNRLTFADRFSDANDTDDSTTTEITDTTDAYTTKIPNEIEIGETSLPPTTSEQNSSRRKRGVTYKVESNLRDQPLRFKDFIVKKRITKLYPDKKSVRNRREISNDSLGSLRTLDSLRNNRNIVRPQLFVDDVVHKIDLVINEEGTEGGAATVTYLRRSGTDAVMRAETPFLILIRHDTTKLPLFYGPVYEPSE